MKVTHCRSRRVVALEEIEDEGPGYLFETDRSEVYYLGGQQFYLDDAFPNEEFEIVEGDLIPCRLDEVERFLLGVEAS